MQPRSCWRCTHPCIPACGDPVPACRARRGGEAMAQVSVAPRRRSRPGRRAQLTFVGLGLTPVMLLLMVFSVIPIVGGLLLSLYHYNGLDPQRSFVGLLNFKHLV